MNIILEKFFPTIFSPHTHKHDIIIAHLLAISAEYMYVIYIAENEYFSTRFYLS
jgi:hypothetical protein